MPTQITTRAGKGSPLTAAELDANFVALREAVDSSSGGAVIESFTVDDDGGLTFVLSNGSTVGPIPLPTKSLIGRGPWVTARIYAAGDYYTNAGSSYLVRLDHVSSTIAADLAAGNVDLLAAKGENGGLADAPQDGVLYGRKAGTWTALAISEGDGSGIGEAPNDGGYYVRRGLEWVPVPAPETTIDDAPEDGQSYVRKDGEWVLAPETTEVQAGFLRDRGTRVSVPPTPYIRGDVVEYNGLWFVCVADGAPQGHFPDIPTSPPRDDDPYFAPMTWGRKAWFKSVTATIKHAPVHYSVPGNMASGVIVEGIVDLQTHLTDLLDRIRVLEAAAAGG